MHIEDGRWAQLTEPERDALAKEIRVHGRMRGTVLYDEVELRAELASDPTYAPDWARIEDRLTKERAAHYTEVEKTAAIEESFDSLAVDVEETGRVDLADRDRRKLLKEVLDETGWSPDDAPKELRGIIAALHDEEGPKVDASSMARARVARDRLSPPQTRRPNVFAEETRRTQAPRRSLSN